MATTRAGPGDALRSRFDSPLDSDKWLWLLLELPPSVSRILSAGFAFQMEESHVLVGAVHDFRQAITLSRVQLGAP